MTNPLRLQLGYRHHRRHHISPGMTGAVVPGANLRRSLLTVSDTTVTASILSPGADHIEHGRAGTQVPYGDNCDIFSAIYLYVNLVLQRVSPFVL